MAAYCVFTSWLGPHTCMCLSTTSRSLTSHERTRVVMTYYVEGVIRSASRTIAPPPLLLAPRAKSHVSRRQLDSTKKTVYHSVLHNTRFLCYNLQIGYWDWSSSRVSVWPSVDGHGPRGLQGRYSGRNITSSNWSSHVLRRPGLNQLVRYGIGCYVGGGRGLLCRLTRYRYQHESSCYIREEDSDTYQWQLEG